MKNILINLGLTENEIDVYLELHRKQLRTAAALSRSLKMDKSSTYRAVESLKKRGLLVVNGWRNGTLYEAANPDILKDLYSEKKAELEVSGSLLNDFIKNLKSTQAEARATQISIEKGMDALRKRMTESLSCKEKHIRERFRHHEFFKDPEYAAFIRRIARIRVKNGIFLQQLEYDIAVALETFSDLNGEQKKYKKEIRVYPEEFKDNNSIRIWDDHVNIISYDKKGEFVIITIVDKYVADMMKNMYDFIWKFSTPV